MKNLTPSAFLLTALAALSGPAPAGAASLLEVYQQALQSDPLIHEAESRRLAAQEASPQARGLLLPQVNAAGSLTRNDVSGSSVEFFETTEEFGTVTFQSEAEDTNWNLSLRQTIFRWDQVVNLRQAGKIVARADVVYEAAQQDLMLRVVERYFEVLAAEDRLTSIHADRQAIARQLEQAKQRFEVGLIAITDVHESQAAFDQSVASEIGAERELATARELLREVTGEYVPELSAPADNFPLPAPAPQEERVWVDLAMEQNLELLASRLDEQIARDEIAFRRTGHYPAIDLVASRASSDSDEDRRFGNSPFGPADSAVTSDSIGIEVTVPLFSGGRTSSQVREAVYLHRASRENLQRVSRETERAARDAYLGVNSEISRVKALEQAVASSRTALEATQAGFDVGTRTIVDVLTSQRLLYQAITNYYQSRYVYIGNVLRLKRAAGTLQVQDLEQIDRWLRPRTSAEDVIGEDEAAKEVEESEESS